MITHKTWIVHKGLDFFYEGWFLFGFIPLYIRKRGICLPQKIGCKFCGYSGYRIWGDGYNVPKGYRQCKKCNRVMEI